AELGIGLISGTVQHGQAEGETFGQYQARIIETFRTTLLTIWGTEPPPVAVAASILVGTRRGNSDGATLEVIGSVFLSKFCG
ncbi:hypothetical protein ACC703_39290, partial [Rhizobium ruizarguesonis]